MISKEEVFNRVCANPGQGGLSYGSKSGGSKHLKELENEGLIHWHENGWHPTLKGLRKIKGKAGGSTWMPQTRKPK